MEIRNEGFIVLGLSNRCDTFFHLFRVSLFEIAYYSMVFDSFMSGFGFFIPYSTLPHPPKSRQKAH